MPKRNLTIHPYDLPGGASQTDVLVTLELVDSDGAPQPGYQLDTAEGVAGTYQKTIRSESVTIPISTTEGLTPTLYWLFKAYWGSTSGYRRYTSGLITLGGGGDLVLPEFLALEMVPGSEAGLTQAEIDAIKGANGPWGGNPFATMEDLEGIGGGHVIYDDGTELPQRPGLEFVGAEISDDEATGKTIVAGLKGADGAQGEQGQQGEQGAAGATGPEGPSSPSVDANNRLTIGSDSLLYSPPATSSEVGLGNVDNTRDVDKPVSGPQQTALDLKKDNFSEKSAFNKDFGTGADDVCEGNDVRLIKLESAANFLQLAAADSLQVQTFYWVPDATFDRPLYFYATGPDTYEVVQPSGQMLRDTHMLGHALVADDFEGAQHGLLAAAPSLGGGIMLFGTDELNPSDLSDATMPVRLYGSELVLRSPTIRATLGGAEIGSPVVVTNILSDADGELALLGAAPAPIPEFSVTGTSAADVPVIDGGGWTDSLAQISGLAQEVEPGASADYQVYISNPGLAPGVVTIGFELEDVDGDPGNWVLAPATFQLPTIPAGGRSLYTGFLKTSTTLPLNSNIRLVASAAGSAANITPGAWGHAANSIGAVDAQTFRTNNQKPTSVTAFRLSNTNIAGQDVSASLLDIEIGSTFTAKRAVGQTTYTVETVAAFGTTGVDIGVSGGNGDNTNWSGEVTFDVVLSSGAFTPNILGSETETRITITVPGSGEGGGTGTISNLGISYSADDTTITNTGGDDVIIPPVVAGGDPGPMTGADKSRLDALGRRQVVSVTADRNITAADDTRELACSSESAINLTMDAGLPIDFEVEVTRLGVGAVTVTPAGSDSINGVATPLELAAQYLSMRVRRYT